MLDRPLRGELLSGERRHARLHRRAVLIGRTGRRSGRRGGGGRAGGEQDQDTHGEGRGTSAAAMDWEADKGSGCRATDAAGPEPSNRQPPSYRLSRIRNEPSVRSRAMTDDRHPRPLSRRRFLERSAMAVGGGMLVPAHRRVGRAARELVEHAGDAPGHALADQTRDLPDAREQELRQPLRAVPRGRGGHGRQHARQGEAPAALPRLAPRRSRAPSRLGPGRVQRRQARQLRDQPLRRPLGVYAVLRTRDPRVLALGEGIRGERPLLLGR